MNLEIANRLVELRRRNGLSQEQLADKLGLSRQAVSKWERAEASPDTDNLILLAKLYGVSLDELLKTDATEEEIRQDTIEQGKLDEKQFEERVEKKAEEKIKEETPRDKKFKIVQYLVFTIGVIAGLVIYLLLSFLYPEKNFWPYLWVIILSGPILSSIVDAIWHKRVSEFSYPLAMVCLYIPLGFAGYWHPGWVCFITIPIFYVIAHSIDKIRGHEEKDDDDDEEDEKED